jgi:hypothetical protein
VISFILMAKSCSPTAQPLPTFTGSLISADPKPARIRTTTTAPIQIRRSRGAATKTSLGSWGAGELGSGDEDVA